jgi:hypothetical protein
LSTISGAGSIKQKQIFSSIRAKPEKSGDAESRIPKGMAGPPRERLNVAALYCHLRPYRLIDIGVFYVTSLKEGNMKKTFGVLQQSLVVLVGICAMISVASAAFASCVATEDASGIATFPLLAGQSINAGEITAQVTGDNLEINYTATDGWTLNEVHLWAGKTITDMPQTRKGLPVPGKFPYASGDIGPETTYTVSIPLSTLPCDEAYLIAAHASMSKTHADGSVQNETAWSEGSRIADRGNWATYSTITLTCDCSTSFVEDGLCETAFAFSPEATCFLDIDEDGDDTGDFNRWGWTIGPLTPGLYVYEMYAGAAQCETSKGTHVGTVHVDYGGELATVTFLNMISPYTLKETQVYVGNEILPQDNGFNTVAPGQYTVVNGSPDTETDSASIPVSGNIYIVAHATVCGF